LTFWQASQSLLVRARLTVHKGIGQAVTAALPATGVANVLLDASMLTHAVKLLPSTFAKVKLAFLSPLDRAARVAAARAIYTGKNGAVLKFLAALALGGRDLTRVKIFIFFEHASTT
jgi:hypothetical protein